MIGDILYGLLVIGGLLLVLGTAAYAGLIAAPWVPTRRRDVDRLLTGLDLKAGETVYDLGAGDGRLVAEAAKRFSVNAIGIELSAMMFVIAKIRSWLYRGPGSVTIKYGNFFHTDLRAADAIVCFLTPMAMKKLGPKLWHELKPGARVGSYAFRIPDGTNEIRSKPEPTATPIWLYRQETSG